MCFGLLLAGTDEAPGQFEIYVGRRFKTYRGMGLLGAMAQAVGCSDRYSVSGVYEANKLVSEGIEGRVLYKGSLGDVISVSFGGIESGMGYVGAPNLQELQDKLQSI